MTNNHWIEAYKRYAGESRKRRDTFTTPSGREIKHLYTHEDTAGLEPERDLNVPGSFPYTRGVYPNMYRARLWTMRQYAGFSTAVESNNRYHYLLSKGQTGLSIAFDLPTQIGYDSDDPLARGEVGRVGVAIDTLADMERLLDGIPLEKISISMTINATAAILLAMTLTVARQQEVPWSALRGTIQNDILKEYIARGTYAFPPEPSMRLITDIFDFCAREVPRWNTISISGYHIREAGATAVEELAFTLSDAKEYVKRAVAKGLEVDTFAPRLSFFFNAHNNLFEEIAKFRAARKLWARIMKDEFGAKNPKSWQLRFHTQTAGSMLTSQQPENNVVRVTLQALAAVGGGTQSLHTNSFDEALGLPTPQSVRVALRTQQIIAHESGMGDLVDPFAGSYVLERWTQEIYEEAAEVMGKIDAMGGALAAIQAGFQQREIQESAYQWQKEMEAKDRIVVGVNDFIEEEGEALTITRIDPAVETEQKAFLAETKGRRDAGAVESALEDLHSAAAGDANLMPPILRCVEAYASLGEIMATLRDVFGEYRDTSVG